jgi:hypothetical protein
MSQVFRALFYLFFAELIIRKRANNRILNSANRLVNTNRQVDNANDHRNRRGDRHEDRRDDDRRNDRGPAHRRR